MDNEKQMENLDNIQHQSIQANNCITSEVLIGMYSRIFTNVLLTNDRIFLRYPK